MNLDPKSTWRGDTAAAHRSHPAAGGVSAAAPPLPRPMLGRMRIPTIRGRAAAPFVHEVDDQPETLAHRAQRSLPSCLSSFLLHVLLLVALAMIYLSAPQERGVLLSALEETAQADAGEVVDVSVVFDANTLKQEMSAEDLPPLQVLPLDALPPVTETTTDSFAGSKLADDFAMSFSGVSGSGIERAARDTEGDDASSKATKFFGVGSEGKRFVFVIDRSGSMFGMRWEMARQELLHCIEKMTEDQEFFVLLYSSDTIAMLNLPIRDIKMVTASPENFQKLYQWISQVYPSGMTRPKEAMRLALELKPDAIYLLSDGEIQDDTYEYLLQNNHPRARYDGESAKTPIHTIALDYTLGALYLQNIARTNNGKFSQKFSQ